MSPNSRPLYQVNKAVHRSFVGPIEGPRTFDPAAITKAASSGICKLSKQAVDIWAGAYGSEAFGKAGVVALTYMPFGGLYLTGGVTSKMKDGRDLGDWLSGKTTGHSTFLEAFLDKGRVTPMLMRVPVYVDMGERGAMLKATRIYLEQTKNRRMSQASKCKAAPEFIVKPNPISVIAPGRGEQAVVQARCVHDFWRRLSAPVPASLGPSVEGLCPLTQGSSYVLYYVHGLDGDAFGPGVTLGELPYRLSCSVCALEYDDEAFACETVDALVKLYKGRIMQDFVQRPAGEKLVLAGRSCGALLACLAALQLQEEGVCSSLVILDSEVVWPSKLDTTFCYEWLGREVEATLWLAQLGGATTFAKDQVLEAVTRGRASPVAEGPARLQTQAYGQCARQLEACGVRSLKDFRNICTLASSNAERLRQLLVPEAGSQRGLAGFFEGRALIIAGSEEREAPLMWCANPFLGDLTVQVAGDGAELYVGDAAAAVVAAITDFLSGPVQDRLPVPGLLALAGNSARVAEPETESALALPDVPSVYLIPGCDGGEFGHLATLAQGFTNCNTCQLEFDEEAMRRTTLSDVATLFARRVLQDQRQSKLLEPSNGPLAVTAEATVPNGLHDSEDEDSEEFRPKDLGRKVVLVGHVTGASLAFEMAMQLQEADVEVALVVIQGEVAWSGGPVPDRCFSASWLGSTCEATLLIARCLGAADFASKEAHSLWLANECP
eukprot:s4914_g3.t1